MQEEIIIWQRYSDKFRMKGKMLYKSFKKRIYSVKLRKLGKQKGEAKKWKKAIETFQPKFSVEKMDQQNEKISKLEKQEAELRKKIENC